MNSVVHWMFGKQFIPLLSICLVFVIVARFLAYIGGTGREYEDHGNDWDDGWLHGLNHIANQ